MRVLGEEQQLCPCYKEYQEFQKLVDLKDSGLTIYCHRTRSEDIRQGDAVEPAVNTSRDVFIIHNKKGVKVTTSELASELEKNKVSCPRCRKIFEHAQELMQEVKSIESKIIMGICDHCRKKVQTIKNQFCACDEIVKKFITVKGEQKEDIRKYVKIWLSKMGHFRDGKTPNKSQQITPHAYSDLQFNRDLKSPPSSFKLDIQQMFYSGKHESSLDLNEEIGKTDIKVHIKHGVAFVHPIEPTAKPFTHTPHVSKKIKSIPSSSLEDSDTTLVAAHDRVEALPKTSMKDHKQEEIFEKVPSMEAKDALKRRHDLSLRQMMRREKHSGLPFSVHKRSDIYETPKIAPWEQKEPNLKYHVESDTNVKKSTKTKHGSELRGPRALDYRTKKLKDGSSKSSEDNSRDTNFKPRKLEKYPHKKIEKGLYDSEERHKKDKKLEDHYIVDTKLKSHGRGSRKMKKQDLHVIKSKNRRIEAADSSLNPLYSSFFFSKDKKKEQNLTKLNVTSSHLIKVTKEKLRLQAEKKKKKVEEERQQKLEEDQKKKQIAEEKKKQKSEKHEESEKNLRKKSLQFKGTKMEYENRVQKLKEQKSAEKNNIVKDSKKLSQEKDGTSEEGQATKKTQASSDEIKVSMSKIQISISKETRETSKSQQEQIKREADFMNSLKKNFLKEKESTSGKAKPEYGAKKRKVTEPTERKAKEDKDKELEMKNVRIQKEISDHILKLVKIKQAANKIPPDVQFRKALSDKISKPAVVYIPIEEPKVRKCQHIQSGEYSSVCSLCLKELESDTLSLDSKTKLPIDETDIIIGEQIFKYVPRTEKTKEPEGVTILFQKDFFEEFNETQIIPQETIPSLTVLSKKDAKEINTATCEGITHYALSDRAFIDKGWTMLPTEKIVRKMNVYRMRPAHPEFDWFEHNKNKRLMTYDTGERLAEFDDNGRGRWYYRSGRLALDYYDAEETNAKQRFVIYSSGEPDERGRTHPITVLATFDYLGNGIVFDHAGKIRLKYNQNEGVILDRAIGPVSHWQWHSLNDPPVLQQVMIDTQMTHKDPEILKLGSPADAKIEPDNEEMLAIEFDNFIKEKSKKLSQKFKPYQIKMKALKINEHFSLKVLDQATVYLIFRDGLTNLKLNIGMILDHREIVDTDTAEIGEVSNSLERFPARTDSLAGLQRSVAHAQRYERQHAERERRLRLPEPCASADLLTAAASPPMRLPLRTVPTVSSFNTGYSSRKPANNLYYDTRLLC